jgi:hypothetical protein
MLLRGRDFHLIRSTSRHHSSRIVHLEDWLPVLVPNSLLLSGLAYVFGKCAVRIPVGTLVIVTEFSVVFLSPYRRVLDATC